MKNYYNGIKCLLKFNKNYGVRKIQLRGNNDYRDRTLFYWAKLYASELKSGETYDKLKKQFA